MKRGVVESFKELKQLASNHEYPMDFYILLASGFRSSKEIKYYELWRGASKESSWDVFHNISDTWCEYENDKDFKQNEPMIMEAIKKRVLIWEDFYEKEKKQKKETSK